LQEAIYAKEQTPIVQFSSLSTQVNRTNAEVIKNSDTPYISLIHNNL
jgi:hypothetical protein